jgi:hypothetical protein
MRGTVPRTWYGFRLKCPAGPLRHGTRRYRDGPSGAPAHTRQVRHE